jgi:hypothetical protein
MAAISDAVVIGIVLGLVFGAVCYYLYSRMTQLERKVGLMENILLDLKVTTEQTLLSVTELPEGLQHSNHGMQYSEMNDSDEKEHTLMHSGSGSDAEMDSGAEMDSDSNLNLNSESRDVFVEQVSRVRTSPSSVQVEKSNVTVNYEAMTYKELTSLAKQNGVTGIRNLSKAQVIDALRRRDGSSGTTSSPQQMELSSWASSTVTFEGNDGLTDVVDLGSGQGAFLKEAEELNDSLENRTVEL